MLECSICKYNVNSLCKAVTTHSIPSRLLSADFCEMRRQRKICFHIFAGQSEAAPTVPPGAITCQTTPTTLDSTHSDLQPPLPFIARLLRNVSDDKRYLREAKSTSIIIRFVRASVIAFSSSAYTIDSVQFNQKPLKHYLLLFGSPF